MIKIYQDKKIEIIEINNEPFLKAKDVCDILGFKNTSDALKNHCETDGIAWGDTITENRGKQKAKFISEGNFYALVLASKNPKAKEFKFWVCNKVLVEIRKTGAYFIATKITPEEHTKREIQVQNSKIINGINYDNGGVKAIRDYCSESCEKITGKRPSEWKKIGKEIGLKSKQTGSGKEVLRNVEGLKKYACALSVSDNLRAMGYDLDSATEGAKAGLSFFDKLLSMGIAVKD